MKKLLYRADAAEIPEIGTGHISRGLLIAEQLKKTCNIEFITKYEDEFSIIEKIKSNKFKFNKIMNYKNNSKNEAIEINKHNADIIILDRLKTTKEFIKNIKKKQKL